MTTVALFLLAFLIFFVIGYVKESPLEEVTSSLEPLPSVDLSEDSGQSENLGQSDQAVADSAAPMISGVVTPTEQGLPDDLRFIDNVWLGDLDEMVERRVIRVLTVFSRGWYFLDGPDQRGVTYEAVKRFEEAINERFETGNLRVHVVIIPVARERLLPALAGGYGDIAAGNLTITPEREEVVDFADGWNLEVDEIVVTGPSAPPLSDLDALGGQTIHVRRSSSYYNSLVALNQRFLASGISEVELVDTADHLEDDDLLEMVNAGLLPMVVVDSHKATFWAQIFDAIELRPDLAVRRGSQIAWALRKGTPQLREVVNEFVRENRRGTLMGNIILNRYLRDTDWVQNSYVSEGLERFSEMVGLFRRYGDEYGFDWVMVAAQGYQESRLDQSLRSRAGAIGVMQLLPSTAADANVGIPDITVLENNIHAGVKYLRFLRDRYFDDPMLDAFNASLLSFAAYNAGPGRVARLRAEAEESGLDPNVWFNNVEVIAAKRIGRETVQYVSNVYKYYVAYRLISQGLQEEQQGQR